MPDIDLDAPGKTILMMGNEAIARGALEAGIGFIAAYPGTPSTEITPTLAAVADRRNLGTVGPPLNPFPVTFIAPFTVTVPLALNTTIPPEYPSHDEAMIEAPALTVTLVYSGTLTICVTVDLV